MSLNLRTLPVPPVLKPVSYEALLAEIKANFESKNPDYTSIVEGDPAYTLLQAMAYFGTLLYGRINDTAKALLITHAEGGDLDVLAALFNIQRRAQETDEALRARVVNSLETLALGSEAWYGHYALLASENINDTRVFRKPDPTDATQDIPGEVIVYVQGITSVKPDNATLQAVRNGLHATGANYGGDTQAERAAMNRRFICDTVTVAPVATQPYVICAEITAKQGLDRIQVLQDVQSQTNAFAEANKRIGQRIPLSRIYATLDTDAVEEVTLTAPTADIEMPPYSVPVAIDEQTLEVQTYKTFGAWDRFADTQGPGWSVGEHEEKGYIVFTDAISTADKAVLDEIQACRRFGIYTLDSDGQPAAHIVTYRVSSSIGTFNAQNGKKHYHFQLDAAPSTAGLTAAETYTVKALNSIEITVAGE